MPSYYPNPHRDVRPPPINKYERPWKPSEKSPDPKSPWKKSAPDLETRDPASANPKIPLRALSRLVPALSFFLPSRVEDATVDYGPFYWQKEDFSELRSMQVARPLPNVDIQPVRPTQDDFNEIQRAVIPEVPFSDFSPDIGPAITRSPKKGTVLVNVPDIKVPRPYQLDPIPDHDLWQIPDNADFSNLWPAPMEQVPEIDVDAPPKRAINPRRPANLQETGVTVVVQVDDNPKNVEEPFVTVKFVPTFVRASQKRRKDTKANRRWIKAAHKFVNVTYGTYSEIQDAMEVIAWNAYVVDSKGNKIPAMVLEDGSLLRVMRGVGRGEYDLDIGATIIDYAVMQATDALQGQFSKRIVDQSIDQGWWTSPQGPQGFVNNQTKGFDHVQSQIF